MKSIVSQPHQLTTVNRLSEQMHVDGSRQHAMAQVAMGTVMELGLLYRYTSLVTADTLVSTDRQMKALAKGKLTPEDLEILQELRAEFLEATQEIVESSAAELVQNARTALIRLGKGNRLEETLRSLVAGLKRT